MAHASSFTLSSPGLLRELVTKTSVSLGHDPASSTAPHPPFVEFNAVWDTGATNSVISQRVVDACGLKPTGMVKVSTAGGDCICEVHFVNLRLLNGVAFKMVRVTKADMGKTDILIGMNIIAMGDFALTHKGNKTCFSFRLPSQTRIDFVQAHKLIEAGKGNPYDLCPCGSETKFRFCCGKTS